MATVFSELPPPADVDAHPRRLVRELAERLGEKAAVERCAELLAAADIRGRVGCSTSGPRRQQIRWCRV